MPLTSGQKLGSYEIVSQIGAGGMGEVYRARDSKLKRDVAIKVLPADVAGDRERLARFQREAEVLASLNHPHIAHVYGIEDPSTTSGQAALVMELVDGEDLSQRIARGAIPLDEALPIAKQIAEALEAAHDAGIIHRDLKPANIKVRDDGTVKVLDFGLAKAMDSGAGSREPGAGDLANSPTLTTPAMTMRGVILGTAAYMSPEQAKGKAVDKRADIWAFGCVLFEMLTGKRTFKGDDVTDIITSVMRDAPDWSALPPATPAAIRTLLRRCLEKDPRKRVPHMAVARLEIDEAMTTTGDSIPSISAAATASRNRSPWFAMALAGVIALGVLAGWLAMARSPVAVAAPIVRFQVATPPAAQLQSNYNRQLLAISPDGLTVVFAGDQLYIRSVSDQEAHPVAGTQGFTSVTHPTFSPDGRSLAFWAASDRTLKRLAIGSTTPTTICDMSEGGLGVSWAGNSIYFGDTGAKGIKRVSAEGGIAETVVTAADREELYGPQLLPDGDSLLFTAGTRAMNSWDRANIVVQSMRTKVRKMIIEGASDAHYVSTGHLLFTRGGVLYAIAFDPRGLATSGQAIAMVEGVRRAAPGTTGAVQVAVSDGGTLAYMAGPVAASAAALQMAIFDSKGESEVLNVPLGPYSHPRVSPDGVNVAVDTNDGKEQQVWIYGLSKVSAARRLTFGGSNQAPTWSADGKRVAFQSTRDGKASVWWQRADGADTATRLTTATGDAQIPQSFSPDGRHLFYDEIKGTAVTLWDWSMPDGRATPVAIPASDVVNDATFSPDGHWFAYTIRPQDPAQSVVYVEPYPPTGARYQISRQGEDGHHAAWSRDGKLLYYTPGPGNRFIALPITTSPTFELGDPIHIERPFVNAPPASSRSYDTTRDGRILSLRMDIGPDGRPTSPQVHVTLHWFEELKQRVPH